MKKYTSFEEEKVTRYIPGTVYFSIIVFSCLSSTNNPRLRFLLICFAREIKFLHQSSLRNKNDFMDIMNVSKNLRHGFVDEKAMITTTLTSSCH